MSPDFLEPEPPQTAHVAGWLDRIHTAARAALPNSFTITVAWNDTTSGDPLPLTFTLLPATFDPADVQYRIAHPVTVAHLDGTGATTIPADTLAYSGYWLNHARIRKPLASNDLTRDLGQRIRTATSADATANSALTLLELLRVTRLRQRVGERAVRNGGHDRDIAALQQDLDAATGRP